MKQYGLLIILTMMQVTSVDAQRVYSDNPPKGKVYTYKTSNGIAREMEIYFPKDHDASKKTVPGIILFHGGGWGGGSRVMFSYQCNYFASRGLVAATVTYRLVTKAEKSSMKGNPSHKRIGTTDAKSAIRWFKQHAKELGVDPKRIIAGGGSAGGHISSLAALNTNTTLDDPADSADPKDYDTSVAALVLFNPAYTASNEDTEVHLQQHLKPDFPPTIAFYGSEDNWMKKGFNPAYEKMKSLGIKSVKVQIADGQGHGFFNQQPWADITLIAADKFLNQLGLIEGEPTLPAPANGEKLVERP